VPACFDVTIEGVPDQIGVHGSRRVKLASGQGHKTTLVDGRRWHRSRQTPRDRGAEAPPLADLFDRAVNGLDKTVLIGPAQLRTEPRDIPMEV